MHEPQVLVAEDEGLLRNLIAEMLTERGLSVMQAADGMEAAKILKENRGISVLLSDIRMPRMDGYDLVEAALAHNPELKVLMMTGNAGDRVPPGVLKAREIGTLYKPFREPRRQTRVVFAEIARRKRMDKKLDDKLDPKAKGHKTKGADFDRNRDGLYGGLAKARDPQGPGPDAKQPHPSR